MYGAACFQGAMVFNLDIFWDYFISILAQFLYTRVMSKKPATNAGIRTVTAVTIFHGGVKVSYYGKHIFSKGDNWI